MHIPAFLVRSAKRWYTNHPGRKRNQPLTCLSCFKEQSHQDDEEIRLKALSFSFYLASQQFCSPASYLLKNQMQQVIEKKRSPELIYMSLILYYPSGPQAFCGFCCETPSFLNQNIFTLNFPSLQTRECGALVWNGALVLHMEFWASDL